ncbi:MAG: pyridoxamine 5'-phosphate oxidase family protein [Candidatus Hodarchaeota archaeon]
MNEKENIDFCNQLMEKAEAAYLTTIFDGYPYTRAVFNLRNKKQFPHLSELFDSHQDDLLVYISTNTSSSKVKHIMTNPAVSIYYCDPKDFRGVMLGGKIEIVSDKKVKEDLWLDWWTQYFPKGVDDEDYTVLRIQPRLIEIYYKLKKYTLQMEEKQWKLKEQGDI